MLKRLGGGPGGGPDRLDDDVVEEVSLADGAGEGAVGAGAGLEFRKPKKAFLPPPKRNQSPSFPFTSS